jgi:hypothetical protein
MGFGDFLKSSAGALGTIGGSAIAGPIGGTFGGMIGGNIEQQYKNKQQFERDKYWHAQQASLQKEFAQKGIQWKVADAKAAGIHPLAALGAQTYSASPSMVGATPLQNSGSSLAAMGQDIGRAIMQQKTNHERQMMDIQLDNAKLDTEMKRLELTNARRRLGQGGQTAPGIPDQIQHMPAKVISHSKGRPEIEAGSITSIGFARTAGGGLVPVPSKDVKERIEDQMAPELVWAGQAYGGPMLGNNKSKPPKKLLPKGAKDWEWDFTGFQWRPVKHKARSFKKRAGEWIQNRIKKQWWYKK